LPYTLDIIWDGEDFYHWIACSKVSVLVSHSSLANAEEHSFLCSFAISISSFKAFSHFLWVVYFVIIELCCYYYIYTYIFIFYIFSVYSLSGRYFTSTFLPFIASLFILALSFIEQQILILISHNVSYNSF
jgi:hypothetical protein